MLCRVVTLLLLIGAVLAAKPEKLKIDRKARTFVYPSTGGTLFEQYIHMKGMYRKAMALQRELIVVYGSDDKNSAGGYNLCDIFDLPDEIHCEKHMKMKCSKEEPSSAAERSVNSEAGQAKEGDGKDKAEHKKKAIFECDRPPPIDTNEGVEQAVQSFQTGFPMKLEDERVEEIQYVQAMLGVARKGSNKPAEYTVVYWGDAHQQLGRELGTCSAGEALDTDSANCKDFKSAAAALVEASRSHCSPQSLLNLRASPGLQAPLPTYGPGLCYIAGAASATAQEAAILLDMGLQSFRGMWLQHQSKQEGKAAEQLSRLSADKLQAILLHIAPASVEVMEWGVMRDAQTFVALTAGAQARLAAQDTTTSPERAQAGAVLVATSLAEHERARAGKTFCTSHRLGLATTTVTRTDAAQVAAGPGVDPTWCATVKPHGYVFKDRSGEGAGPNGEDDGPFESETLNRVVVGLALSLLHVFSSRFLQLALGALCVLLLVVLVRLCYGRWKRTSTKTT